MPSVDDPLSRLLYPSRMERVVYELKLETVGDVVKLRPGSLLARRAFGRKTLRELGAALKNHLGDTWEEAHLRLGGQQFSTAERGLLADEPPRLLADIHAAHVASFRRDLAALPAALKSMSIRDAFPSSFVRMLRMQGPCSVVADIGTLPVLDTPRSGTFLVAARPALDELRRDPLVSHATWRSFLYTRLASIDPHWRRVLEARAGFTRPRRTLDEIAIEFRVTRQAVQQLEKRAIERLARGPAPFAVRTRLNAALDGESRMDLRALRARDPFFGVRARELNAFSFLLNRLLGGDVRLVQEGGRAIVVRAKASTRSASNATHSKSSRDRQRSSPINPATTTSVSKRPREEEILCAAAAMVGLDRALAMLLDEQERIRRLVRDGRQT